MVQEDVDALLAQVTAQARAVKIPISPAICPRVALNSRARNVVILPIKDKTYNGKLQKPAVKVKAGKKTLKKNKDYTVRYKANLHAGTATVTITGKGNYTISAKQTFQIKKLDIKKVSVKGTKTEGLILTYKNRVLRENVDYTLEYGKTKGNKIEVVIHAAANSDFTGSVTKSVKVKDSKKAK